jgi:hypothetical protein
LTEFLVANETDRLVTSPRTALLALLSSTIALVGLEGCQSYQAPAPTPGQIAQAQRRPPPRPPRPPAARPSQDTPPAEATGVDTPPSTQPDPVEPPGAQAGVPPGAVPPTGLPPTGLPPTGPPPANLAPGGPSAALPQRVTGLRAEEVRQRLGAPQSQRTAGAARVWRYQGRECTVEIYFYYDTGQADFFALEQRLEGQAASPEACLATIPAATRPS